jgi:hypothetical protein
VDAFDSGYASVIGHDASATTGFSCSDSPITEFTTAPLTPNGIVTTPEPSSLALAASGGLGLLLLLRRQV